MVLEPWRRSGDEQAGATVSHSDGPGGGHWGPTGGVMVIMQCSSVGEVLNLSTPFSVFLEQLGHANITGISVS